MILKRCYSVAPKLVTCAKRRKIRTTRQSLILSAMGSNTLDCTTWTCRTACYLPFSIPSVFADEAFEIPRLCGHRDLSDKLLVDFDAQTRPLQSFHETVLDSESFWIRDVAVDVVLTSCTAQRERVRMFLEQCWIWSLLPSTL